MTTQELIFFIVKVLSGTGVFLIGVNLLTVNIEQLATSKIKSLFSKTANKKLINVGIGAATTAFIQSSGVTTVLIVGFVNVGVLNLTQACAMIMGANIGTTITAQIAALSAFPITTYIQVLTFLGIFASMIFSSDKIKKAGMIIAGLGLVFIGLSIMSSAMENSKSAIEGIFSVVTNPFLLLFIGIILTAIVQSSSATTSVIIAMSVANLTIGTGGNEVLFIILGTNIGSCVTALLSSVGTNANAKRASLIHLMFNTFGAILFFIIFLVFPRFMELTFKKYFTSPATQIAMFHTFFNVTSTLIFLPFTKVFVKLSELFIKVKDEEKHTTFLDERILSSSSLAISQLEKELVALSNVAMDSFRIASTSFLQRDTSKLSNVSTKIEEANNIMQNITSYLIKVSSKTSESEEVYLSNIHSNVGDIMRISEIADNFIKYTKKEVDNNIVFSDIVMVDLKIMIDKVERLYSLTIDAITTKNSDILVLVDSVEDEIDGMRKKLIDSHIDRLNKGLCKPESSSIFINLVSNLERLGDHLTFIAHTI